MLTTPFNDDELKFEHWRVSEGGSYRITHLPTGISVFRDCGTTPVRELHVQLLLELAQNVANHLSPSGDDDMSSGSTCPIVDSDFKWKNLGVYTVLTTLGVR